MAVGRAAGYFGTERLAQHVVVVECAVAVGEDGPRREVREVKVPVRAVQHDEGAFGDQVGAWNHARREGGRVNGAECAG